MAIRAIESRFERMSVNEENEPVNGGSMFQKSKVCPDLKLYCHHTQQVPGIALDCHVNIRTRIRQSIDLQPQSLESTQNRTAEQQRSQRKDRNRHNSQRSLTSCSMAGLEPPTSIIPVSQRYQHILIPMLRREFCSAPLQSTNLRAATTEEIPSRDVRDRQAAG